MDEKLPTRGASLDNVLEKIHCPVVDVKAVQLHNTLRQLWGIFSQHFADFPIFFKPIFNELDLTSLKFNEIKLISKV